MSETRRLPTSAFRESTGTKTFGDVLRLKRRELNMSQKVLADQMETSQEVISNYENGVTSVRVDDVPRLAKILGVTPSYFFESMKYRPAYSALQFKYHEIEFTDNEIALFSDYRRLSAETQAIALKLLRALVADEQ